MPRNSQIKVFAVILLLVVLTTYYVTNGARDTKESPFYTRTVAAIQSKEDAAARKDMLAEEKTRMDRVDRLREEHDVAVSKAAGVLPETMSKSSSDDNVGPKNQQPIVAEAKDAVTGELVDSEKSVAGRKKMKDDKATESRPPRHDDNDGVAKVGNVGTKPTSASKEGVDGPESDEDRQLTSAFNDILKKGPIIIFSKTYCPYSKKAKHILQDLYTITPPPVVVELDEHRLGEKLQQYLGKSTGRRTVPNVLVNAKSIGGGDDIAELHSSDKLIETLQSMGGKRITSIVANKEATKEVKFKA